MKSRPRRRPTPTLAHRRPSALIVLTIVAAAALLAGAAVAVVRMRPQPLIDPIEHLSSVDVDGTYDIAYWSIEKVRNPDRWTTAVSTCKRLGATPNCHPVLQLQLLDELTALRDQIRDDALHPERIRERVRALAQQSHPTAVAP